MPLQLVCSEKYLPWRGPRYPCENFSHVNKSWFTVFNTFCVLFTISYSVFSISYPVLLDLLILSEKSVSKIDFRITNFISEVYWTFSYIILYSYVLLNRWEDFLIHKSCCFCWKFMHREYYLLAANNKVNQNILYILHCIQQRRQSKHWPSPSALTWAPLNFPSAALVSNARLSTFSFPSSFAKKK